MPDIQPPSPTMPKGAMKAAAQIRVEVMRLRMPNPLAYNAIDQQICDEQVARIIASHESEELRALREALQIIQDTEPDHEMGRDWNANFYRETARAALRKEPNER